MPFQITYDIDYSGVAGIVDAIERVLNEASQLKEAVRVAGDQFAYEWTKTASVKLRQKNDYIAGIANGINYPADEDGLVYKIRHTDKVATYLENGYGAFDMKKMLDTSPHIKISKEGRRFLIIPFKHGTPGSKIHPMPEEVFKQAKELKYSSVIGTKSEGSIQGFKTINDAIFLREMGTSKVERRVYDWAGKEGRLDINYPLKRSTWKVHQLNEGTSKQRAVASIPHTTNIYQGMVRFQANPSIARQTIQLAGHSIPLTNETDNYGNYGVYMTFRVMVEGSAKWIHPGLRAMNILGETIERTKESVLTTMAMGAQMDVDRWREAVDQGLIKSNISFE